MSGRRRAFGGLRAVTTRHTHRSYCLLRLKSCGSIAMTAISLTLILVAAAAAPSKHSDAASRIRRAARNRASSEVGVDPLPLQGKLAIVTGGGRGIGAAVARALAQRGCRVLITYRSNVDAATDTMMALPGDGHDARQCDVTGRGRRRAALRGRRRGHCCQ